MVEETGKQGILVNGLLAWIIVTKESRVIAILKQVAEHHFDEEEVHEARNLLLATVPQLKEQMPDIERNS